MDFDVAIAAAREGHAAGLLAAINERGNARLRSTRAMSLDSTIRIPPR